MKLVDLGDKGCSLEFRSEDWPSIRTTLDRLGRVKRHAEATYDVLTVSDVRLMLLNEWDDPCLIASDDAGKAVLNAIATSFRSRNLLLRHARPARAA